VADSGLIFNVDIAGNASVQIDKLNAQFNKFNTISERIKSIDIASKISNLQNVAQGLSDLGRPGIDFEASMADLSAITGIVGEDLKSLEKSAREVGVSTGLGAAQSAEAYKLLASNIDIATIGGIEGLQMLQKETITLSKASGVDMVTSANTMASAINQYSYEATEASRVTNVLAAGAKYGAAEIPELAASLKVVGTTASLAGVEIEGTVAALEILSQNAVKGGEAGTGLRNVLLALQTKELPGVDLKTQGLSGALAALGPMLNDTKFLSEAFGKENISAAQILIKNAAAVEEMTQKVTGTQVAYEQALIKSKTWSEQVAIAQARVDDWKISIMNATGGMLPFAGVIGMALVPMAQLIPLFTAGWKALSYMKTQIFSADSALRTKLIPSLLKGATASWGFVKGMAMAGWNAAKAGAQFVWTGIKAVAGYVSGIVTATVATWSFNAALLANPIVWIGIAVAGLIVGIIAMIKHWDKVKEWFMKFKPVIMLAFAPIFALIAVLKTVWEEIKEPVMGFFNWIGGIFSDLWNGFRMQFIDPFMEFWEKVKTFFGFVDSEEKKQAKREGKTPDEPKKPKVPEGFVPGTNGLYMQSTTEGESTPAAAKPISSVEQSVTGGGNDVRNNNIRIENLVRNITLQVTNLQEGTSRVKEELTKALIGAVRDTEIALS
jgi:TP901 family phage tail tape measure protein